MPRFAMTSRIIVDAWERRHEIRSYETNQFIAAAREVYGEVVLLNPHRVAIELPRHGAQPRILHEGNELPRIDTLLLRGTKGLGAALTGLVMALKLQGCEVLDAHEEFDDQGATKLPSSFRRFEKRVGSSTYLAFSKETAEEFVRQLAAERRFPLLGKPVAGRKGRGITALPTLEDALEYVRALYEDLAVVMLLQTLETFVAEYRVMVFLGQSLGVIRKIAAPGEIAANYDRGGTFVACERPDVEAFAIHAVDPMGIFGVDIGETEDGTLTVIENNRAPNFAAFDAALGHDTARKIVDLARLRVDQRLSNSIGTD